MLVDLQPKNLTGKVAEGALDKAGITVNKNAIPFDPQKPFITSGIRIGTPAITTRGLGETEMDILGDWIGRALDSVEDDAVLLQIREEVRTLCEKFPLYSHR